MAQLLMRAEAMSWRSVPRPSFRAEPAARRAKSRNLPFSDPWRGETDGSRTSRRGEIPRLRFPPSPRLRRAGRFARDDMRGLCATFVVRGSIAALRSAIRPASPEAGDCSHGRKPVDCGDREGQPPHGGGRRWRWGAPRLAGLLAPPCGGWPWGQHDPTAHAVGYTLSSASGPARSRSVSCSHIDFSSVPGYYCPRSWQPIELEAMPWRPFASA